MFLLVRYRAEKSNGIIVDERMMSGCLNDDARSLVSSEVLQWQDEETVSVVSIRLITSAAERAA